MEAQQIVEEKPFAAAEEKFAELVVRFRVEGSVRGADDVERTHHRQWARGLLTVFGLVTARLFADQHHDCQSPIKTALRSRVI